jgi:hypothetical protein
MKRDPKPSVTYALWSAKFRINLGSEKKKCVCWKKKGAKPILYHRHKFCLWIMIFL